MLSPGSIPPADSMTASPHGWRTLADHGAANFVTPVRRITSRMCTPCCAMECGYPHCLPAQNHPKFHPTLRYKVIVFFLSPVMVAPPLPFLHAAHPECRAANRTDFAVKRVLTSGLFSRKVITRLHDNKLLLQGQSR